MSCHPIEFGCKPRADGLCATCWQPPRVGVCPALVRLQKFYEQRHERPAAPSPGLGDRLERTLGALGITAAAYQAVKARFGLPPTCGCARRKQCLNRVSAWWRSAPKSPP